MAPDGKFYFCLHTGKTEQHRTEMSMPLQQAAAKKSFPFFFPINISSPSLTHETLLGEGVQKP